MNASVQAETAAATWFFTLSLHDRGTRWLVDHVAHLRHAFKEARARHAFDIEAIVVLPEHLHAVWRLPVDDVDFASRWLLIKETFSNRLAAIGVLDGRPAPRRPSAERSVWQRRFWDHRIVDDDDLRRHVEYIHFNPVKHGWVKRAGDWPYSSFHRFVKEGRLAADWGIDAAIEGEFGE